MRFKGRNFRTDDLVFSERDHILAVIGNLYFGNGLSVLISIEFLPFAILFSEAQQLIIASSRKYGFAVTAHVDGSTEFVVQTQSPVFVGLLALDELFL